MLDFILRTSHIKLLTTAAQIISNDVMLVYLYVTDGNILTDCTFSGANTTKKRKGKKTQKRTKTQKSKHL